MKKSTIIILAILGVGLTMGGAAYMNIKNNPKQENNPNSNIAQTAKTSQDTSSSTYPGYQLEKPKENEEIAIMKTNVGEIKIRFFPEAAPKAVENFKSLSKNGYYENVIFHRVIKNFMIQSGDPKGNGTGGESVWKKDFEDEFSKDLFNITGALSMANRGPNTNGSQFFINYQEPSEFIGWGNFEAAYKQYNKNPEKFGQMYGGTIDMSKITEEIKKLYAENGGNPHLDGYYSTLNRGHTVFGQVFDGMDVVKKISETKTDETTNKPLEEIKIEKITITPYKA